jgi:SAM-dependent methyltransferase
MSYAIRSGKLPEKQPESDLGIGSMTKFFSFWLRVALVGSVLMPLVVASGTLLPVVPLPLWQKGAFVAVLGLFAVLFFRSCQKLFGKFVEPFAKYSDETYSFLANIPPGWHSLAIITSAAVSLILELSIIRWQSSEFEFFAFYKNFSLIACFAGLGVGYGCANKKCIPLFLSLPLLLWQFVLLIFVRHVLPFPLLRCLLALPVTEQTSMGLNVELTPAYLVAMYFFLTVVFILTALALLPVGQLCGQLVATGSALKSYGFNLLGSLVGVVAVIFLSALWTPPVVWFGLACLGLLPFLRSSRGMLTAGGALSVAIAICLAWPLAFPVQRIYSPYQLLELAPAKEGGMLIRAAGLYYQMLLDLSPANLAARPELRLPARYYAIPYLAKKSPGSVLVLGAGTGNDVAAALRAGAQRVVAVEIDPAIIALGRSFHPEGPYQNPKVTVLNEDARAFLRNSKETFDLIVFGLLDSHTTSSNTASLRLDSYVYTLQSLTEARAHLKDDGVMCLSFSVASPAIAKKLYFMLEKAFDGHIPVCLGGKYNESFSFLQAKGGGLTISSDETTRLSYEDLTDALSKAQAKADISDDNWPFFYMPQRIWPVSYLPLVFLAVGITYLLIFSLQKERLEASSVSFFLLGAGFMLVETKAIAELSLYFGSTWTVTAITISAIMLMAFLANFVVQKTKNERLVIAFIALIASLAAGYVIASQGGMPITTAGKIAATAIITCPIFFSGLVFSFLLKRTSNAAGALSANILGAMLGGMLEYSAMYLGYRALYLVAIVIYALAFASSKVKTTSAT